MPDIQTGNWETMLLSVMLRAWLGGGKGEREIVALF